MINLVHSRFEARKPITDVELMDLLQIHHQVSIASDTPRHTIRNLEAVKPVISRPKEAERVVVDPAEIQAWFEELAGEVADVPRDFVVNVDEIGCSDRIESREVRVIAPSPTGSCRFQSRTIGTRSGQPLSRAMRPMGFE
jgi:hypothetical protein